MSLKFDTVLVDCEPCIPHIHQPFMQVRPCVLEEGFSAQRTGGLVAGSEPLVQTR